MTKAMIKGITVTITNTFYRDIDKTVIADLTGAVVYFIVKNRPDDLDAAAIFSKSIGIGITVPTPSNGKALVVIAASDTNSLTQKKVYYETFAKLADGTIIRNGINELALLGNVRRSLV